ncbi:MAG: sigma 54-interacting transcriptional regulator [Clostridia bacterium]|nr:sigma 54-interacting transcriptional regulator [Clostridia bacterium]
MIKTALIIKGRRGVELFHLLKQCSDLDLIGLVCLDGEIEWLTESERKKYFVTADLDKIAALPELETVIEGTGDIAVVDYLKKNLGSGVRLEELKPGSVLNAVINSREQLLETRMVKGELLAVFNSVQDAIEVVDAKGIIKYVNPAFTRVTGITGSKRLGRNLFEASPHGALAQALIQQKPVTGYRTYVGGSDADVISNASPIIVDGELMGAVVVFQPVGDILKLMDELKHSNAIIDNLYAQIDQISGSRISFESLTGQSKVFTATLEKARKAARSESTVLISGESGTEKSLFAQAMHNSSIRKKRPLIVVDCALVPDSLQEVEIFGCEKGAMPGVLRIRLGKIELAEGSTLFIKEINALSPFLQILLLRVLNEQKFCRIGGDQSIPIDVRIIASASEDLVNAYLQDCFSEELYQKLSLVTVNVPPLRKRSEDIPLLAEALLDRLNRKLGKKIHEISPRALQELTEYDWPGNISELKSVIERAMVVADSPVIEYHHLSPYIGRPGIKEAPVFDEVIPIDKVEEMMLKLALTRYGETLEGKKKAAQALNISLATLYNKLKRYSD